MNSEFGSLKALHNGLDQLTKIDLIKEMFEFLPNVSLFVKDVDGFYIHVNGLMAETLGMNEPQSVLGKTDFDLFPLNMAKVYVNQDNRVIKTGQPIWNEKSFMIGADGLPIWFRVSKIPLYDECHRIFGVAGVKYACHSGVDQESDVHSQLRSVLNFISKNFAEPITVNEMAATAQLSISQLQRVFRRELNITPVHYLLNVRIGYARHLLKSSNLSMATISNQCGFYDQSHFSRSFKITTGLTPLAYRTKFTTR